MTWLILREPGKVPEIKGPFGPQWVKAALREFMEARPSAFITVLDINHGQPSVQDGPECLEMLDGRSTSTARKHRASTRAAFSATTVR